MGLQYEYAFHFETTSVLRASKCVAEIDFQDGCVDPCKCLECIIFGSGSHIHLSPSFSEA